MYPSLKEKINKNVLRTCQLFFKHIMTSCFLLSFSESFQLTSSWFIFQIFLEKRNGSNFFDGLFTMGLGLKDFSNFGQMVRWNGTNQTPYYPSYCGKVNGSAGELFPPFLEPTKLSLFITDICRLVLGTTVLTFPIVNFFEMVGSGPIFSINIFIFLKTSWVSRCR